MWMHVTEAMAKVKAEGDNWISNQKKSIILALVPVTNHNKECVYSQYGARFISIDSSSNAYRSN